MKQRKLSRFISTIMLLGILVGVHKGRIALWQDGAEEPFKVFPYRVSMLPEEQEQMVKNGIHVESMEELQKLVEKYLP